jgi:catechol 2,3-dioxygenase-like lactoylglutathione lyase family enzyme
MAKVLGLGGVFFRSPDPPRLRTWYARWLGLFADGPGVEFFPDELPEGAYSVWSPFPEDTRYFDPSPRDFMINLIVDDLDGMLARVRQSGARVIDDIEENESGRFGWFVDPDGNKVELWEPPGDE